MTTPIFSTYAQGENRITSTLLSVFDRINSHLVEDILVSMIEETQFSLVTFENQYKGVHSIPDRLIKASSSVMIETKRNPRSVTESQIEDHVEALKKEKTENRWLLVLTPDGREPQELSGFGDEVIWKNFDALVDIISEILRRDIESTEFEKVVPTEREKFLLRELIRFFEEEDLLSGRDDRILVVAAGRAWEEYKVYRNQKETVGFYFCQPNRFFRPSAHLAFYKSNEIKAEIPRIKGSIENIELTEHAVRSSETFPSEVNKEDLLEAIAKMRKNGSKKHGKTLKVLFLDRTECIKLDRPIDNDKEAKESDRRVAFTQGHTYVSKERVEEGPEKTSELEE